MKHAASELIVDAKRWLADVFVRADGVEPSALCRKLRSGGVQAIIGGPGLTGR